MAISYASSQTQTSDGSSTITVTKPTSLAEGDLMVCGILSGADTSANSSATGWTALTGITDSTFWGANPGNLTVLVKIADSSDVAASNFTFTLGGGNDESAAILSRYTASVGSFSLSYITADSDASSGASVTFSGGVTPPSANCMLVMFVGADTTVDYSSYAITTSNPTWTEITEVDYSVTNSLTLASAYATRPEQTATGDYSVTSSVNTEHLGALIAILETVDVTVTGSTGVVTLNGNAGTVTGTANVTGSTGVLTLNGNAGTVSTPDNKYTDESVPTGTWTDENVPS